jgi:hypothetical protein
MTVAIGGIVLPGVVGAGSPGGIEAGQWVLASAVVVLGFGFSRAHGWGLWGVRLALPPLALWAAALSPLPGAVAVVAAGAVMTIASWSRESLLAVYPLLDALPGPRRSRPGSAGAAP